jgi:ABC-2 type transport system ATP-binding protein
VEESGSGAAQAGNWNIVTSGLSKEFDGLRAVDRVDLRVAAGEFFGFIGPNGAGKTTTINLLCGLLRPTQGSAQVAGFDPQREPAEVKARIGVLQEEPAVYEELTGAEFLQFVGGMRGLTREEADERAQRLLAFLLLTEAEGQPIGEYSAGMRKKIGLAAALMHRPQVLLLDEPFNGVDPISSRSIKDLLLDLTRRGATVFFSSHVLEVTERLCSRVAIIHKGRLVACDSPEGLRAGVGLGEEASLEDVFLRVVGGGQARQDLDWLLEGEPPR